LVIGKPKTRVISTAFGVRLWSSCPGVTAGNCAASGALGLAANATAEAPVGVAEAGVRLAERPTNETKSSTANLLCSLATIPLSGETRIGSSLRFDISIIAIFACDTAFSYPAACAASFRTWSLGI